MQIVTWLISGAVAAPCERTVEIADFQGELVSAWREVLADDPDAARPFLIRAMEQLPCVAEPLDRLDAAALHRSRAVEAHVAGDDLGARSAALAVLRLAPDAAAGWARELDAFDVLLPDDVPPIVRDDFGTSLAAAVYVDGSEVPARVVGQPAVVQVFDQSGEPLHGAWLDGRDPLPDWVAFPRAQCNEPVPIAVLLDQSNSAEAAYVELQVASFNAALRSVAAGLPCVSGRVGTRQAAAIHRLEGLRLYTLGAEGAALRSLQQAQALDPLYTPPQTVVRPESALEVLWTQASTAAPSPWITTPVPDGVQLVVDGTMAGSRPTALPTIVQVSTRTGEVLWTRYVPAGATLPSLDGLGVEARRLEQVALPPAEQLYLETAEHRARLGRRSGLLLGGVLALTGSAALFVENTAAVTTYQDPATAHGELPGLRSRANVTASSASVLMVVGTGLVGAAILLP